MRYNKTIAVIPARGGSKGIPNKNIVDFCGRPLVAWTIIQAMHTKEIDAVYVSSDSEEILSVGMKYGAKAIKRPAEISGDRANTESAIQHALEVTGNSVGAVVILQPTSPLRKSDDLSRAISQFRDGNCDSLFSGAVLEDFLIWEKDANAVLKSLNYDYKNRGMRQDRAPQYVENGSIYISKPKIIADGNRLGGSIGIYLMNYWQSFEIDCFEDLEITGIMFELKLKNTYHQLKGAAQCPD